MDAQRRLSSVRRYLSEADEKEALRVLKEQLRHQKRVTSDDVRLAVRAVASQEGAAPLPPDFPPSRWVLEFKRVHGFVQFNSFAFGAAAPSANDVANGVFGLPERLEVQPFGSAAAAAAAAELMSLRPATSVNNNVINDKSTSGSSANVVLTARGSDEEKDVSQDYRGSLSVVSAATYAGPRPLYHTEAQRQVQLQHGFSQRHQQLLQQQQRRAMVVGDHRRAVWPETPVDHEELRSSLSSGSLDSENGTTTGPSNSSSSSSDVGPVVGMDSIEPHFRHAVSVKSAGSAEDMQDSASNVSSSTNKRNYKLSHTVPAETWEKAIAAVEQQGMSLRAAAKMYGVHFAALHRRVKKRAQGGQSKGNNGYFHPSDEAGIMRVVVARAELGVLMTFNELMRLVEAAALRKLPDISVDSARKLLARFQSRNEQSIRHIIEDWPPPCPVQTSSCDGVVVQHRPYLEHPGFDFGPKLRPVSPGVMPSKASTAAAMAAAAKTNLFVLPSRLDPFPSQMSESRRSGRNMNDRGAMTLDNGAMPSAPNERLRFGGARARSEGGGDAPLSRVGAMVV
ncbi:hypothetical protein P3T76_012606 [Phytophthora citrophthora]|uniref:HTH psq-type domain-containing protein n=1 Tax=Phytophthora citrophthora TaxID=4793 RepID=A0AAD9LDA2_9STRA|nr:hypothetical protein P3T76_012606 [Phytophthora citrophthora]